MPQIDLDSEIRKRKEKILALKTEIKTLEDAVRVLNLQVPDDAVVEASEEETADA